MPQNQLLRTRSVATAVAVASLALLFTGAAEAGRAAHGRTRPRAHATTPARPAHATAGQPASAAPAAAGMVISIDPETGALVAPTAEQMLRLTPAERTGLMRTAEGLTQVRLPGGGVMVDLQGRFLEFSVVQLDLEGRPRLHCVDDAGTLRALLAPCAPAPTPALEEK
jgi:hypothetical protein